MNKEKNTMISWNSFKDATPKQDILDKCDNQILICENSFGFAGMPTKCMHVSSNNSSNSNNNSNIFAW